MTTEREKMLAGELYGPLDLELVAARTRARDLCRALNETRERRTQPSGAKIPHRAYREHQQHDHHNLMVNIKKDPMPAINAAAPHLR